MEYTFFINALIGMRTEIVTLRLDQVCRQYCGTIAVIISNRCREGRYWNAVLHRISNNITQSLLVIVGNFLKVRG